MVIVSDISTSRLHYVLDYVFNMRLGIGYSLQTEQTDATEPTIFYTTKLQTDKFSIPSSGLLSESDVWQFVPDLKFDDNLPIIFSDNSGTTFKFDIFAAIFWMLSRYEEYLPFLPDAHGRFTAVESFSGRNGLLENPIVDRWILLFRTKLQYSFPKLKLKSEVFEFQPTIDVDSPWSYRHKGIGRNVGGLFRDVLKFDFRSVLERLLVLAHLKSDPFYTFDYIAEIHKDTPVKFFVLTARHGRFDKSINPKKRAFKHFLSKLAAKSDVGLHPSYVASQNEQKFASELQDFQQITNSECHSSRQHFLRVVLPEYYRMLNNLKISVDYSFGYADNAGFRAGTSRPFKFYDLLTEQTLNVVIQPLIAMDVTLRNYMNLTPEQATQKLNYYVDVIKQTNGLFTTLWHNQHFLQRGKWQPWDAVYLNLLSSVKS